MKRSLSIVLILLAICTHVSAFSLVSLDTEVRESTSYGLLDSSLVITLTPERPLYREAIADPYAMSSSLAVITMSNEASIPMFVRAATGGTYQDFTFRDANAEKNSYYHMKTAVNLGLLRVDWNGWGLFPRIEAELSIQGGMHTIFNTFGGTDTLGFDGMYFLGTNVRVAKVCVFRFGMHHFSGHYGDEMLDSLYERNPSIAPGSDARLVEYTRDNSWLAGISIEPNNYVRLYAEAELPMGSAWIRPAVHVPSTTIRPGSDDYPQYLHVSGQEGISPTELPPSYKAWRLQGGCEIRIPVPTIGNLFAAVDVQLHQDGQTKHMPGLYAEDNPWEAECTAGAGLELNQRFMGRSVRIEWLWHAGRFPLQNFFYQRSTYVSVGMAISG